MLHLTIPDIPTGSAAGMVLPTDRTPQLRQIFGHLVGAKTAKRLLDIAGEDVNALARAGRMLGIPLVDHLIIASGGTVSFYDTGLLPTASELQQVPVLHEPF